MTDAQKCLVTLIRGVLNENYPIEYSGTPWRDVYNLACEHSVVPLLYYAVEKGKIDAPEGFRIHLQNHFMSLVMQLHKQKHYLKVVSEKLSDKKIRHLPVKGQCVRECYPEEEMRSSCDVDIFYDISRTDDVKAIAEELKFSLREVGENHYEYENGNVTLELHYALTPPNSFLKDYYGEGWERLKTEDGYRHSFNAEDNYIYIILHFVKHFLLEGGGIRQMADIYMYNTKHDNMDRDYLNEEFEKLGIVKFVSLTEIISQKLFDKQDFTDEEIGLIEHILNGSTYGDGTGGVKMRFGGNKGLLGKLKYILYRTFPPLEKMKSMYPILHKAPYLLAVLWVVRWVKILLFKKERITRVIETAKETQNNSKTEKILEIVDLKDKTSRFF